MINDVTIIINREITSGKIGNTFAYNTLHGQTYSKSMDQPGKVANPARGQLKKEKKASPQNQNK